MWSCVFEITDIAKTIVAFLPSFQYLQWIKEADDVRLQTQLCTWCPTSHSNSAVKRAIVAQNNWDALCVSLSRFSKSDWRMLVKCADPDLLQRALQTTTNEPQFTWDMLNKIPMENFKVVTNCANIDAELQHVLIHDALSRFDTQKLMWMLNRKQWCFSIDNIHHKWTDELWTIIAPSVFAGRVRRNNNDPSALPWQMMQLLLKTTPIQRDVRYDMFRICANNIRLAAVLWLPEFDFGDTYNLNSSHFAVHNAVHHWTWNMKFVDRLPPAMFTCENALGFLESSNDEFIAFKTALHTHMYDSLFKKVPCKELKLIFKRACSLGAIHIVKFIWNNSVSQDALFPCLGYAGRCANIAMVEFAFEQLQRYCHKQDFEAQMIHWNYDAYDFNNVVLWNFLISQDLILVRCYSDSAGICVNCAFARTFGTKSVEFVSLLWPTHKRVFMKHAKPLLIHALESKNIPLLQFLGLQDDFELNQKQLRIHFVSLATCGLVHILRKVRDTDQQIEMLTICNAYRCALDTETVRALWNLHPHITRPDAEVFATVFTHGFALDSDAQVEKCMFFLEHKLITHKHLYDMVFTSGPSCFSFGHELFGRLYYDFDL